MLEPCGGEVQQDAAIQQIQSELPANPNIRLQAFLQQFDIPADRLPDYLKEQYEMLVAGQRPDGNALSDEEYVHSVKQFVNGVRTSGDALQITPESMQNLDKTLELMESGDLQPNQILDAFKGYISGQSEIPDGDRQVINEAIEGLQEEAVKPKDKRDEAKIKKNSNKILTFFKKIGGIILSLLSFGLWRGTSRRQTG